MRVPGVVLVLLALSGCGSSSGTRSEEPVEILPGLEFTFAGRALYADVYRPARRTGPLPAIIWIHGGAWKSGSRSDAKHAMAMAARGFVTISIDHRLSHEAVFPGPMRDVETATRWVRNNAARLGVDPEKIGLWGASSGGHLALCVALSGTTRVQAVCAWHAPSNLAHRDMAYAATVITEFLGASPRSSVAAEASPVTFVTGDDPPVLLIHGLEDKVVPPGQSERLHERLELSGVSCRLVLVEHASHGFEPLDGDPDPSIAEIVDLTADFFAKHLK